MAQLVTYIPPTGQDLLTFLTERCNKLQVDLGCLKQQLISTGNSITGCPPNEQLLN